MLFEKVSGPKVAYQNTFSTYIKNRQIDRGATPCRKPVEHVSLGMCTNTNDYFYDILSSETINCKVHFTNNEKFI